ncbi:MAG TPA: hypothetical protein VM101_15515 [Flavitalea sp.]|nr:hypothetical protein [Flavitalea sp.]
MIRELDSKPIEQLPFGSAPNSLAISPDGKNLYVANALECLPSELLFLGPNGLQ